MDGKQAVQLWTFHSESELIIMAGYSLFIN